MRIGECEKREKSEDSERKTENEKECEIDYEHLRTTRSRDYSLEKF